MSKTCLVSCSSIKRSTPMEARMLYCSKVFELTRDWVELNGWPWYVLSAKHFLLNPSKVVAPYDNVVHNAVAYKYWWSKQVYEQLIPKLNTNDVIVFYAGIRYRKLLAEWLIRDGFKIEKPYENTGSGNITSDLQYLLRSTTKLL